MPPQSPRILAIDWSGDRINAGRKIWLAEAVDGYLVRLEHGRDREEIARHLLDELQRDPHVVIGLDFAFSFPESFCHRIQAKTAYDVWSRAASEGERWLAECLSPFWGKPGRQRDTSCEMFRRTELTIAKNGNGARPKSIFQIGGAGSVGTASIRGMPLLKRLHDAGVSIWPFDPACWPLIVEIYPRLFTGPVNKSSSEARELYLCDRWADLSSKHRTAAATSDDAFDAAVSALVMSARAGEFADLHQATAFSELLEGRIWY